MQTLRQKALVFQFRKLLARVWVRRSVSLTTDPSDSIFFFGYILDAKRSGDITFFDLEPSVNISIKLKVKLSMRSSRVVRAPGYRCLSRNRPGFNHSK
jgi:hypothetical protein